MPFAPLPARAIALCLPLVLLALAACTDSTGPGGGGDNGFIEPLGPPVTAGMFDINDESSACGVTVAGRVYCWGYYGDFTSNFVGASVPAPIEGNIVFASVSDGGHSTCGLTLDGTAYCWGRNDVGQMGTGAATSFTTRTPQLVAGGHKFKQIDLLMFGGSGVLALTTAGKMYAWGTGTLGDGSTAPRMTPVAIAPAQTFTTFSVAGASAIIAIAADGVAWSWGGGIWAYGEMDVPARTTPAPLASTSAYRFASVAGGSHGVLFLTTAGEAYAFGEAAEGGYTYYGLTRVAPGLLFTKVATALWSHMGLTADGRLYAWGLNDWGQVGDGTTTRRTAPVQIGGALRFREISARHQFSAALSTTGELYFWGRNEQGIFGNGAKSPATTTPFSATPLGPRSRSLSLSISPASPTLNAGETLDLIVTVTRIGGGFTTSGVNIGAPGPATISVQNLPSGITASFPNSATIAPNALGTILRLKASTSLTGGVGSFGITAQSSNMPTQPSQPISVLKVNSSGGTGLSLQCAPSAVGGAIPSGFPPGYHCMRNSSGEVVVGKFAIPTLTSSAWWVDETADVCVSWRSTGGLGRSTARFKGGLGGGTTETQGHWGLLVGSAGLLEGVPGARYLFTSNLDAQTQLLTFNDQGGNVINNYNFSPSATCPW